MSEATQIAALLLDGEAPKDFMSRHEIGRLAAKLLKLGFVPNAQGYLFKTIENNPREIGKTFTLRIVKWNIEPRLNFDISAFCKHGPKMQSYTVSISFKPAEQYKSFGAKPLYVTPVEFWTLFGDLLKQLWTDRYWQAFDKFEKACQQLSQAKMAALVAET